MMNQHKRIVYLHGNVDKSWVSNLLIVGLHHLASRIWPKSMLVMKRQFNRRTKMNMLEEIDVLWKKETYCRLEVFESLVKWPTHQNMEIVAKFRSSKHVRLWGFLFTNPFFGWMPRGRGVWGEGSGGPICFLKQ